MDKNSITGFVLIALVLIGFSYWAQPSKEEQEKARQEQLAQINAQKKKEAQKQAALKKHEAQKAAVMQDTSALFYSAPWCCKS